MSQVKITQLNLELVNRPTNRLKATQMNVEIVNRPPNSLKTTQLCVEVAIKIVPQTYTDSAAATNFAF